MRHHESLQTASRQRGVVLFVALILLLILSLLGVTAARMQTTEERMARNEDNRQIGAQAAEAALRAAETGLANGLYGPTQFANDSPGFYTLNPAVGSVLQGPPALNWSAAGAAITYPDPANPMPALTQLPAGAQSPKYIIENLPAIAMPGDSIAQNQYSDPVPPVTVYRVTANATGADSSSTTILLSIFR
jgi:type IV pilus assembly protein PilX